MLKITGLSITAADRGLRVFLLADALGQNLFADTQLILPVEPSSVALARAATIYSLLAPGAAIKPINKDFNALEPSDFLAVEGATIHLFSNVLDIDGYDHVRLLRMGLSRGAHTVIAIGHDRTQHGYSQGLERVKIAVDSGTIRPGATVLDSRLERFECPNRGEPAILWLCKLQVQND